MSPETLKERPLLLRDRELAELLGVSRSMVHKLHAQGALPAPVKLGRCTRWNRDIIELWQRLSCPRRDSVRWAKALEKGAADD
jgi:excisionase family DNA binding protein